MFDLTLEFANRVEARSFDSRFMHFINRQSECPDGGHDCLFLSSIDQGERQLRIVKSESQVALRAFQNFLEHALEPA